MTLKSKPLFNFKIKISRAAKSAILLIALISVFLLVVASISILTSKDDDNLQRFEMVNGVLKKYYGTDENVIIPNGVRQISKRAFADCDCMTDVTIPDGVEEIGEYAFDNCLKLTDVKMPDSIKAIQEGAFRGTNLKKVNIPRGVEYIDKNAFQSNPVEITVSPLNKRYSIKDGVLYNKDMTELIRYYNKEDIYYFKIPDGVERIGNSAFLDCNLTDVYICGSVKEIGDFAFMGCRDNLSIKVADENQNFIVKDDIMFSKDMTELLWYSKGNTAKSYAIPNGVKIIRAGAFQMCDSLHSITIPDSVEVIGDDAFRHIRYIKSLKIPDSVSEIGEGSFLGCFILPDSKGLYVGEDNKYFILENGVLYNKDMSELIYCFPSNPSTEVTIPKTVKKIRNYAFCQCYNLNEVKIPDSVVEIGEGAFALCSNIKSTNLPAKITSIANSTFWGCDSIGSINIPNSVQSIGDRAFSISQTMTSIKLPNGIRVIGKEALSGEIKSVNIPASTIEIADDAFESCIGLEEINVDAENKQYSSKDGVLFNKEATRLIKYPGWKSDISYTVPYGTEAVCNNAFSNNNYLLSINISSSVNYFSKSAFAYYTDAKLTSINVETDNKNYASKDGVLFDKKMKVLIMYPYARKDKEYAIPEGVTTIKGNAFVSCYNLLQLTFPESVTIIEEPALNNRNEQLCIKGHEYSVAHEYATANYIPFISADNQ
jgi:hypothetical protein